MWFNIDSVLSFHLQLLHCIGKLDRLDIKVQHLQSTGIGKTVNNLRKYNGVVGEEAKMLVNKWKNMVATTATDSESDERITEEDVQLMPTICEQKSREKSDQATKHDSRSKHEHRSHDNNRKAECIEQDKLNHRDEKQPKHSSKHHRAKDDDHHNMNSTDKNHRHTNKHKEHKSHSTTTEPSHSSKHKKRSRDAEHSQSSKKQKLDTSTSTTHTSQESSSKKSSKTKTKSSDDGIEIDYSMGTSFADALGMLEMPSSSSSTSSKANPSSISSTKPSSRHLSQSTSSKCKKPYPDTASSYMSQASSTPALLQQKPQKLPPLEDLSTELLAPSAAETTISNDYRPMPVNAMVMDYLYKAAPIPTATPTPKQTTYMNEADALCASTTSKNIRTKVYSGIKTGATQVVPSLFDVSRRNQTKSSFLSRIFFSIQLIVGFSPFWHLQMCIRYLQKNIDSLEYTGGIPFDILQSVLERATPEQLSTFEHFNPYVMDDTDKLWQQHCQLRFRAGKRNEMESWREMFVRCTEERDARLNSLTNIIKQSQKVAIPVRQTKLAYVDSMVKPPRSVIKKQNQFGTHNKLISTPAARVESLKAIANNITKSTDTRLRTLAAVRDTAQAQPSNGTKIKKAPLMVKTLQLMKGRYRR